jgi:hypothetical protein
VPIAIDELVGPEHALQVSDLLVHKIAGISFAFGFISRKAWNIST